MDDSGMEIPPLEQTPVKPRATKGKSWGATMKWVRRIHLYSGIFMFPWVMLYGVTALLFNRPDVWPRESGQWKDLRTEYVAGTSLDKFPTPGDWAAKVVDKLNELRDSTKPGDSPYRLVSADQAMIQRELNYEAKGETAEHFVRIDLSTGKAEVRSQGIKPPPARPQSVKVPFAQQSGVQVPDVNFEAVQKDLEEILYKMGLEVDEMHPSVRVAPTLSFLMEAEGKTWKVSHQPLQGSVSAVAIGEPLPRNEVETRQFLLRLHTAHGYPEEKNARWFWAICVDVMFASMVFWGVSGLMMWWQLRTVRAMGSICLVLSVVCATGVTIAMHEHIATEPPRGRGPEFIQPTAPGGPSRGRPARPTGEGQPSEPETGPRRRQRPSENTNNAESEPSRRPSRNRDSSNKDG